MRYVNDSPICFSRASLIQKNKNTNFLKEIVAWFSTFSMTTNMADYQGGCSIARWKIKKSKLVMHSNRIYRLSSNHEWTARIRAWVHTHDHP